MAKMSTLQDAFPGGALNGSLWGSYGTLAVPSGILTLTDTADSTNYSGIQSSAAYDLTASYFAVQLVSAGSQFATTQAMILVMLNSTNTAELIVSDGSLDAQTQVAGSYTTLATATYSAATMKWLRLRESGGTLFFDYSADGTNWTSLTSVADPFTLTSFNAVIQQGSYTAVDPQTASQWASCNVLPSPLGGVLGSRRSRVVAYPRASRARSLALARPVPVQPSVRCLQPAAVRRPGPPRERPLPPLVAASGLAPASSRAGHREQ